MGGVAINKPANADPNAAKKGLAEGTPVAILANTEVTAQWRSKWSKLRDKMLTPSLMGTEVLAGPVKAMRGDSSLRLVASDFGIDLKGSTIDRSLGLGVGATTEVIGGNVFEVIAGTRSSTAGLSTAAPLVSTAALSASWKAADLCSTAAAS